MKMLKKIFFLFWYSPQLYKVIKKKKNISFAALGLSCNVQASP